MTNRTSWPVRSDHATAAELKVDKTFQPCPVEPDDELFPNGIFEFNITRLLAFVEADVGRFPIERIEIDGIPNYGGKNLDVETIDTAHLLRPIILAEISPGLFSVIDGHHRVAKARREGAEPYRLIASLAFTTSKSLPLRGPMSDTLNIGMKSWRRVNGDNPYRSQTPLS